eukprot:5002258-Lingulodinium_polyedra.AAC.1
MRSAAAQWTARSPYSRPPATRMFGTGGRTRQWWLRRARGELVWCRWLPAYPRLPRGCSSGEEAADEGPLGCN